MNRIIRYIGIGASVALAGCGDTSNYFHKEGKVGDYESVAFVDVLGRHMRMYTDGRQGGLFAIDGNNDGRFDDINLENLPKGHPLEAFASLDKLEQAYDRIVVGE